MQATREALLAKEFSTLESVQDVFQKWLLLKDTETVDILLASVIAHGMQSDPLWMFLVAPPASAKTEFVRALSHLEHCYLMSSLTATTFLSGQVGKKDASLLPSLTGQIMVFKDFTTVLSMYHLARAEIFAQLREIYDGYMQKNFGTGARKQWSGKVGMIAAVTEAIDSARALQAALGERYLLYRLPFEQRADVAGKAIDNLESETEMRRELAAAVSGFFSARNSQPVTVTIDKATRTALIALADVTAKGRTGMPRDGYQRVLEYTPNPESPARLVKQLTMLGKALAMLRGHTTITEADLKTVRKVALDTMIQQRVSALMALWPIRGDQFIETQLIIEATHIPGRRCLEVLEDCWILNIVERDKKQDESFGAGGESEKGRKPYKWRLDAEFKKSLDVAGLFHDIAPF